MFDRLRAALRPRPAPTLLSWEVSVLAEPAEFIDVLPVRTPGLAAARRHAWAATSHALGALRDADTYADARLDPSRSEEAHVRHVAALHQLDAALAELAAARRALTGGTR
jgi:hypothetical protein